MSMTDVLQAFDPIDRGDVTPPDLAGVPWGDLDFLAWRGAGESKAYMVVPLRERSVGMILTVSTATRGGICDLCLSVDREGGATSILVQSWARPRTSYGICVCNSLACSEGARGLRWVYRMGETISVGRRVERLQENVERFARLVTGVSRG